MTNDWAENCNSNRSVDCWILICILYKIIWLLNLIISTLPTSALCKLGSLSHYEFTQVPSYLFNSQISLLARNQTTKCPQNHLCHLRSSSKSETCTSPLSSGRQHSLLLSSQHLLPCLSHSLLNGRLGTVVLHEFYPSASNCFFLSLFLSL